MELLRINSDAIFWKKIINDEDRYYLKNNLFHREDGPAVLFRSPLDDDEWCSYMLDGLLLCRKRVCDSVEVGFTDFWIQHLEYDVLRWIFPTVLQKILHFSRDKVLTRAVAEISDIDCCDKDFFDKAREILVSVRQEQQRESNVRNDR